MRADLLPLLLSSSVAAAPHEDFPLDRVRMQKAVFLCVKRGAKTWNGLYDYRPYNWGPYSAALTRDLGRLVGAAELAVREAPGSAHDAYVATDLGEARAADAWRELSPNEAEFIRTIRAWVTSRTFAALLRDVYAAYPEYATESRFIG